LQALAVQNLIIIALHTTFIHSNHLILVYLTLSLRTCLLTKRGLNFQWRPPIPTRISRTGSYLSPF